MGRRRGGPSRTRVAVILAVGVSASLFVAFFFAASPWTPEVNDDNAERLFAALGAVIAALAVWLGGYDETPPGGTPPAPPEPSSSTDTGDDE